MAKTIETIATINSAVRTFMALVVCAVLGIGGWVGYRTYNAKDIAAADAAKKLKATEDQLVQANLDLQARAAEIRRKDSEIKEKNEQIAKMETSLRLLKVRHRLARLNVLDQHKTDDGKVTTTVEFIELNDEGQPIGEPKRHTLVGNMLYVEGLKVTFDDKYIEQADLDRSSALFVFTRLYSDQQSPKEGFPLDPVGSRPLAYARGAMSPFEKRIWDDFWSISNDEEKARELGITAAHGNAVFIQPQKGTSYKIELRSTGEVEFKPDGKVPGAEG
jgi:hypothetical protein